MVHKRLDLFKLAIDSLRASDFDRNNVPLIISHDGRVPEVMSYVEELKSDFLVIQIFHPYSCFEHPHSFPGNDESLNTNYAGDRYGNKRSGRVTCLKHHFTWMLKSVFDMDFFGQGVDAFAFFEEDYLVSTTIYETVVSGLRLYDELSLEDEEGKGYFGVVLEGRMFNGERKQEGWDVRSFRSGPFILKRHMYLTFLRNAGEYCTYDDYNWDWSIVHLMSSGALPSRVLYPSTPQVMHIGIDGGTHSGKFVRWQLFTAMNSKLPAQFHGTKFIANTTAVEELIQNEPFGGWGHVADHEHCLKLLLG